MTVGGGAQDAPVQTTFLLADTQIPKESFLEDTSSLLNNGEVGGLNNAYTASKRVSSVVK